MWPYTLFKKNFINRNTTTPSNGSLPFIWSRSMPQSRKNVYSILSKYTVVRGRESVFLGLLSNLQILKRRGCELYSYFYCKLWWFIGELVIWRIYVGFLMIWWLIGTLAVNWTKYRWADHPLFQSSRNCCSRFSEIPLEFWAITLYCLKP